MQESHVNAAASALPQKPLWLALVTGLCLDASWATLFSAPVDFSIFPLLALGFAAQQLYQFYMQAQIGESLGRGLWVCTLIGFFGHSAFVKVLHPELGSNFFSLLMVLGLLGYFSFKLSQASKAPPATTAPAAEGSA
ncbi:MAG: DUF1422 family protein [Aeromonas sp.]